MTNSNGIRQFEQVKAKAIRALGLIKHAKKFLPSGDMQKMHRGIVEPHFSYCCSVWRCCSYLNKCPLSVSFYLYRQFLVFNQTSNNSFETPCFHIWIKSF